MVEVDQSFFWCFHEIFRGQHEFSFIYSCDSCKIFSYEMLSYCKEKWIWLMYIRGSWTWWIQLGWGAFRILWDHTFAPPSKVSYLCIEHKNQDFLGTGLFLTLQPNVKDLYRVYYRKYCWKWVKIQISTMACRLEMIYTSFRTAICTLVFQISILSTLDWHFRS